MDMTTLIIAMGVPSAITGFSFWLIEQKINRQYEHDKAERKRRQEELDAREKIREQNQLYMLKAVQASLELGEATAKAVQRIPDAHCNGDMHSALDFAQKVKFEQKDFLREQAVKNILN